MRRLFTLIAALSMLVGLLAVPAVASAKLPPPVNPAPCVAGVVVRDYVDDISHNQMRVTITTTCLDATTIDTITYDHEVIAYWIGSHRGGRYMTPAQLDEYRATCLGPTRGWPAPAICR